jgi:hypothetical protein
MLFNFKIILRFFSRNYFGLHPVMGHTCCAFDNCFNDLANTRNGVFCAEHELSHGHICHIKNCQRLKVGQSMTCHTHQNRWQSHLARFGRQSLLGVRRLLRRSEEERVEWLPNFNHTHQEHDVAPAQAHAKDHYFTPSRVYCVETICAPYGVVIAWAKFAKSESETNILAFLEFVYPTPDLRPDYICIDKACKVLRTAIANGSWEIWKETTRFIVDSYHYINHRVLDYLCWTWCNPAPLNGSAPNLVVVEEDNFGKPQFKRAFNTQVSYINKLSKLILILS